MRKQDSQFLSLLCEQIMCLYLYSSFHAPGKESKYNCPTLKLRTHMFPPIVPSAWAPPSPAFCVLVFSWRNTTWGFYYTSVSRGGWSDRLLPCVQGDIRDRVHRLPYFDILGTCVFSLHFQIKQGQLGSLPIRMQLRAGDNLALKYLGVQRWEVSCEHCPSIDSVVTRG